MPLGCHAPECREASRSHMNELIGGRPPLSARPALPGGKQNLAGHDVSFGPTLVDEPSMSAPLISVIIPHYNDLTNLERCLTLLAAQTLPKSQFEVIIADNNSRCGNRRSPPDLR